MGLKAGLQILQQTVKAVAKYADDAARLVAKNGDDVVGIFCRKPVTVNPAELKGLRFASEAIGDTVQIKSFIKPTQEEISIILKRHKISDRSLLDGTLWLDKSFINENNSIFLKELDRMFPAIKGQKNVLLEDILVCLENINHSAFKNKHEFLNQFIRDMDNIKAMTNAKGELLFNNSIESLYSIKAILQAKYNRPERYQEILDLYDLIKKGKAPDYIIKNLLPEANFHHLAKSDIEYLKKGTDYFQCFINTTSSIDGIAKNVKIGEVVSVNGQMFVKTNKGLEGLKLDEEVYRVLFPALDRYCLSQVGDSCYFVSVLDGMIKNPETRVDMYKMFEQVGKNKVRVTLPQKGVEPIIFDLSDISYLNEEYVQGALAYKMIEECCRNNYSNMQRSIQNFNRGGQPHLVMELLYKDGVKSSSNFDIGIKGLHHNIECSSGTTILIPRAEYLDTPQNRNIGLWGGHCYSTQKGNFFNPVNSIEEVCYPKEESILQIFVRL